MATKSLPCPFNSKWIVLLDSAQVNKADPGEGTPAMVYGPHGSCGTLWTAMNTGEVVGGDTEHTIPHNVLTWLQDVVADEAESFLYEE